MECDQSDAKLHMVDDDTSTTTKNIRPLSYKLHFIPSYKSSAFPKFACEEVIRIEVLSEISQIVLNAVNLSILSISYEDATGGNVLMLGRFNFVEELEIVEIDFDTVLPLGNGNLLISFEGVIADDMKGFYKSKSFQSPSADAKKDETMLCTYVTQFEPCFARRAFLCWDEPDVKATFDLSLVIPKGKTGLSNLPVVYEVDYEKDKNFSILRFVQTPIMSTYLLAFVIGEYEFIEAITTEGIVCRVFTPIGKRRLGEFALNVLVKSISFFTSYFGVAYPLPKLDLVPVQEFTSGSMENWGLITFREKYLLVDEEQSSASTKQCTALIIAHEISQQWFGNLVTNRWSDMWLKEALSSFLEYRCVSEWFSNSNIWTHFEMNICRKGLSVDAFESSHPIKKMNVDNSPEYQAFDIVSHLKGASIIRMLHTYLTEKVFQKGLNSYLTEYAYKTAMAGDFWTILARVSSVDVSDIMNTWTSQKGFPLIKIVKWKQMKDTRYFLITQEKFCANLNEDKTNFKSYRWNIPLDFTIGRTHKKIAKTVLMEGTKSNLLEVLISGVQPNDWVKINATGFYRVHYPPSLLEQFLPAIHSKQMLPLDRINLLDDLYAIVMCGEASTVDLLRLLKAYISENNYNVWTALCDIISRLSLLLEFTSSHDLFNEFGISLLRKVYQKLEKIESDGGHFDELLRSVIMLKMVELGDNTVITQAKQRFALYSSKVIAITVCLRPAIYRAILVDDNGEGCQSLSELYRETDSEEEKMQILNAFGCAKTAELVEKMFSFILSDECRAHDISYLLSNMCTSKFGIEKAWDFFKGHISFFRNHFQAGATLSSLVKRLIENFSSSDTVMEIETFFEGHHFDGMVQSVRQGIESIQVREAWLKRDGQDIENFLVNETSNLIIVE